MFAPQPPQVTPFQQMMAYDSALKDLAQRLWALSGSSADPSQQAWAARLYAEISKKRAENAKKMIGGFQGFR